MFSPAFIQGFFDVIQYLQVLVNMDNMQGGEGSMETYTLGRFMFTLR